VVTFVVFLQRPAMPCNSNSMFNDGGACFVLIEIRLCWLCNSMYASNRHTC
jgi:hypothetical protein